MNCEKWNKLTEEDREKFLEKDCKKTMILIKISIAIYIISSICSALVVIIKLFLN